MLNITKLLPVLLLNNLLLLYVVNLPFVFYFSFEKVTHIHSIKIGFFKMLMRVGSQNRQNSHKRRKYKYTRTKITVGTILSKIYWEAFHSLLFPLSPFLCAQTLEGINTSYVNLTHSRWFGNSKASRFLPILQLLVCVYNIYCVWCSVSRMYFYEWDCCTKCKMHLSLLNTPKLPHWVKW